MNSLLFLIIINHFVSADVSAEITISNLKSTQAPVFLAVYQAPDSFLDEKNMYKGAGQSPEGSENVTLLVNLPAGDYALAVFQDMNGNRKLDTNFLEIPVEPYGFSRNFKPRFSAPDFKDCQVQINREQHKLSIKLFH